MGLHIILPADNELLTLVDDDLRHIAGNALAENLLAVNQLLGNEAGNADHSEAALQNMIQNCPQRTDFDGLAFNPSNRLG